MLGLCRELELDDTRIDIARGDDDHLRRPAGQVDRHIPLYLELRLVHIGVPGADDLVDPTDVGEPADRPLVATPGPPDLVDAEHLGRRRDEAGACRRGAHDEPLHARGPRRDGIAVITSVETRLRGT